MEVAELSLAVGYILTSGVLRFVVGRMYVREAERFWSKQLTWHGLRCYLFSPCAQGLMHFRASYIRSTHGFCRTTHGLRIYFVCVYSLALSLCSEKIEVEYPEQKQGWLRRLLPTLRSGKAETEVTYLSTGWRICRSASGDVTVAFRKVKQ